MPKTLLIPVGKFLRLLDYMERIGLDPDAMAEETGYSQRELESLSSDQRLPGTEYSRMYKNAVGQISCEFIISKIILFESNP